MRKYVTEVIKRAAFFQGLPPEDVTRLATVCAVRKLKKREVIFREEEQGDYIYLLESGSVQLFKATPDGGEIVIRTIQPGEVFAEVILFEKRRYPVTARVLIESRLLCFLREDFLRLLADEAFRLDFIAALMMKQRYLAERVAYLTSYDVEERFRRFLGEQYGAKRRIEVALPKKDIAAAIGATPETFSRLIQRLKASGALTWKGRALILSEDAGSA